MLGKKPPGYCVLANQVCPENGDPSKGAFCPYWRAMPFRARGADGLPHGDHYLREDCVARMTYQLLTDGVAETKRAAATVQEDRNEQKEALATVDAAARALGADEVLATLAGLGMRSYIAERAGAEPHKHLAPGQPPQGAESPNEDPETERTEKT